MISPGVGFKLLPMIGHVVVAGTLEIRMGVQADCDIAEMDINMMQFVRASASYSRIICCMHIQRVIQKRTWESLLGDLTTHRCEEKQTSLLGYVNKSTTSTMCAAIIPLYAALGKPHLSGYIQFGAMQFKKGLHL